jgi:hypothetical protein
MRRFRGNGQIAGQTADKACGRLPGCAELGQMLCREVGEAVADGFLDERIMGGSVAKFDFWAKSKNLVSEIQ